MLPLRGLGARFIRSTTICLARLCLASPCKASSGGAALWVVGLLAGEGRQLHLAAISMRSWIAIAYLMVFGTGIGFTAYVYLLKKSTAARVGTYAFVNPVVALFLGWLGAGETITLRTALGRRGHSYRGFAGDHRSAQDCRGSCGSLAESWRSLSLDLAGTPGADAAGRGKPLPYNWRALLCGSATATVPFVRIHFGEPFRIDLIRTLRYFRSMQTMNNSSAGATSASLAAQSCAVLARDSGTRRARRRQIRFGRALHEHLLPAILPGSSAVAAKRNLFSHTRRSGKTRLPRLPSLPPK